MSWVRVDDQFPDHPKLMRMGKDRLPAMGLWVVGLCYAARYLTDGFIPDASLPYGCKRQATLLVSAGLWGVVDGGYQIHDYREYQLSRVEVMELRAKNAERQSRRRHGVTDSVTTSVTPPEVTRPTSHTDTDTHTEVPLNVSDWAEPATFFEERTGRKPSAKVRDWLEDLHARFSRKELLHAMTVVPGAKESDWLKKVDAYLEHAA